MKRISAIGSLLCAVMASAAFASPGPMSAATCATVTGPA